MKSTFMKKFTDFFSTSCGFLDKKKEVEIQDNQPFKRLKTIPFASKPDLLRAKYISDQGWKELLKRYIAGEFAVTYEIQKIANQMKDELNQKLKLENNRITAKKTWSQVSLEYLLSLDQNMNSEFDTTDVYNTGVIPEEWKYAGFIIEELLTDPDHYSDVNEELLLKIEVLLLSDSFDLEHLAIDDPFHSLAKIPRTNYEFELSRNFDNYYIMSRHLHQIRNLMCNRLDGLVPGSLLNQFKYHSDRKAMDELSTLQKLLPYIICPEKAAMIQAVFKLFEFLFQNMPRTPQTFKRLCKFFTPAFFGKNLTPQNLKYANNFIRYLYCVDWADFPVINDFRSAQIDYIRCRVNNM